MIIVGERLNSSRQSVLRGLKQRNEEFLIGEAQKQKNAGASYIDLNTAALLDKEVETLKWAIPLLQKEVSLPLSIDTPSVEAMEEGLKVHKGQALLNSVSGETKKIKLILPLIIRHSPRVIALCLDDNGMPMKSDQELMIAERIVSLLEKEGVKPDDIFIDPLVRPIGVDHTAGELFLDSLEKIKKNLPQVKTIAGVSNVSFGLPHRKLLNRTLLVLALQKGLDAAILDPLDKEILAATQSAQALLGKDISLKNYLAAIRAESSG